MVEIFAQINAGVHLRRPMRPMIAMNRMNEMNDMSAMGQWRGVVT